MFGPKNIGMVRLLYWEQPGNEKRMGNVGNVKQNQTTPNLFFSGSRILGHVIGGPKPITEPQRSGGSASQKEKN